MKLHKVRNWLPLSAAATILVSNQGVAEASTIYTVKKNDTLSHISNQYGVSIQSIKQANHKENNQIYVGEQLTIPSSPTVNNATPQTNLINTNNSVQSVYQVQKGDTLQGIANQYNISIQSIKQANHIDGDRIYAGQHLIIRTDISEEEMDLMARLVTAEAGGESYDGKVAVATKTTT